MCLAIGGSMIRFLFSLGLVLLFSGSATQADEPEESNNTSMEVFEPTTLPPMNPEYVSAVIQAPSIEECRARVNRLAAQVFDGQTGAEYETSVQQTLHECFLSRSYYDESVEMARLERFTREAEARTAQFNRSIEQAQQQMHQHQVQLQRATRNFQNYSLMVDQAQPANRPHSYCDARGCFYPWARFECQFTHPTQDAQYRSHVIVSNHGGDTIQDLNSGGYYVRYVDHLELGFLDIQILRITYDHRDAGAEYISRTVQGDFTGSSVNMTYRVVESQRILYADQRRDLAFRAEQVELRCSKSGLLYAQEHIPVPGSFLYQLQRPSITWATDVYSPAR